MPPGWVLQPVTRHPCLLFGPEDRAAIKTHLEGNYDLNQDRGLATYLAGSEDARRKATDDFNGYWRNYSKRWGEDAGGVALRGVRRTILIWDLVASYGSLTAADEEAFKKTLVAALERQLGTDYRNPRITPSDGSRRMNIWTDLVAAAGFIGLAFPELPQSRAWIEFAVNEINWQLERGVWDGAWHECPRYHAVMLNVAGLFYQMVKRRAGVDLFQHPQYKALLDWYVRFQTPRDLVFGQAHGHPEGTIMIPGLGDSSWESASLSLMAQFAPHYLRTDPRFAARLMWTWERAGRPWDGGIGEAGPFLIDPTIRAEPQMLASDISPGKGHIVMRSGFDTPEERWLLLRCGRKTRSGHDHADWNAFNLYAFGIPLALDAGSGAYSDPMHKQWHDKAVAHNTVVFGDRSQQRKDAKIIAWATTPGADYSVSDASAPAGVRKFIRHVLFMKPEYFVIWDELDADEPTHWMLHTTATDFKWDTHQVRCETPWNVDLDVHAVWPSSPLAPGTAKGKFGPWVKAADGSARIDRQDRGLPFLYQEYFGIPNEPGKDFLVVLHPRRRGQSPLTVEDVGQPGHPVVRITNGAQIDTVRLAASSAIITRQGPEELHLVIQGAAPMVPDELR